MAANRDYVFPARIRAQCIWYSDGFRNLYYSNTVYRVMFFNKCLIIIIFILVWRAWVYKIIGSRCLESKTHVKYIIMTVSHKLITVFCNKFLIQWGGNGLSSRRYFTKISPWITVRIYYYVLHAVLMTTMTLQSGCRMEKSYTCLFDLTPPHIRA